MWRVVRCETIRGRGRRTEDAEREGGEYRENERAHGEPLRSVGKERYGKRAMRDQHANAGGSCHNGVSIYISYIRKLGKNFMT